MRYGPYGYPEYVSVAQKRAKAEQSLQKLKKKDPNISPVVIEGSQIAKTWWGKAWIKNIESYADYSNRVGRGRTYVRNGTILDLKIDKGTVKALVQGTRKEPYSVQITFSKLNTTVWNNIKDFCQGRIESMQDLLSGKFQKDIGEKFTMKGEGLFPAPKEIKFTCNCPDWASMCKHVAAVLYAIGARFDKDAGLFFTLRDIDMSELIKQVVLDKTANLVDISEKAKASSRVLEDDLIGDVFGIELEEVAPTPAPKSAVKKEVTKKEAKPKKTTTKRQTKKTKTTTKKPKKKQTKKAF